MSLATRCSACGTVFRVVQDQLKVSEGWVRCGRCNEIFNALEGLFDLDRDSTPESWAPTVPDPGNFGPPEQESLSAAFSEGGADEPADPALVDRIDAHLFGPRRNDHHRKPLADVDERDQLEFADARLDSQPISESPLLDLSLDGPALDPEAPPLEGVADEAASPPDFLQRAERAARWQSSGMRRALGGAVLLLSAGLALQVAHHQRDAVAAHWPELRPNLDAWCEQLGCRIEPLRRIEDISVESTALTRAPAPPADAFKLAVALRNRGALPLALPSVDLSLTDAGGQLVARRALAPQDFQFTATTLAPGAEAAMQLTLSAGSPRVSGYTVEIFYP